jgi:DNA polymerase-3 subunit gamma/tau
MAYLVLARKYRPQNFEDVVKQEHVTRTLKNAISSDRVAHAVLFSGPRGTGKTTVARILAKAMNCEKGPTPHPCNQCSSCREITASAAVDVFEIDGASNNSVEQIRELRDNIKYLPAHGRYKIYIIDEVHMLSTAAFNALLKTLEEPPAHVLFIFATTEPHKIPLTILSRCQRYDFRRIDVSSIADHLEKICAKENVDIPGESLDMMAREAGGCMRDALSLLDQVMSCSQAGLLGEQIFDILGMIDRKVIFNLSEAVLTGNISEIIEILDQLYERGQDIKKLYSDVLEHLRNLVVVKIGEKVHQLVDVPDHEIDLMAQQVQKIPATHLSQLFDLFFREEPSIKYSAQPKLAMEMACIRMCQMKPALDIDKLIDSLQQVNRETHSTIATSPVSDEKSEHGTNIGLTSESYPETTENPGFSPNPQNNPTALWSKIIEMVQQEQPLLSAALAKSKLSEFGENKMTIEVEGNGFNVHRINKNLKHLKKVCGGLLGKVPEITILPKETVSSDHRQKFEEKEQIKREALNHPMVTAAQEIFNGQVIDVKILQEESS